MTTDFDPDQELPALVAGALDPVLDEPAPPTDGYLAFEDARQRAREHGCQSPWFPGAFVIQVIDHAGTTTVHEIRHPDPLSCVILETAADDRVVRIEVEGWAQ